MPAVYNSKYNWFYSWWLV